MSPRSLQDNPAFRSDSLHHSHSTTINYLSFKGVQLVQLVVQLGITALR
jgi:hypothetical protein